MKHDLKGAITCPKCCTAPVYDAETDSVKCPYCGFSVRLKHGEKRGSARKQWDDGVARYEAFEAQKHTLYKNKPREKAVPGANYQPCKHARVTVDYSEPLGVYDGEYYPACSEEASRIRLGFENAAAQHYHRTTLYDSVDNPFFSDDEV